MRRHRNGGDLSLVTHLGEEKRHQGRAEYPKSLGDLRFLFFDLVGNERPDGHADEREPEHPSQDVGADRRRDPGAERAGEAVIDQRGDEDAENDRDRLLEARRKDERQQLRLVADLGERDDPGRNEYGFHLDGDDNKSRPSASARL